MLALQAQQDSLCGVGFAHAIEYRAKPYCSANIVLLRSRRDAIVVSSND
jgi:hypothetical protein